MKNLLAFLLCLLPIICLGQPGYISTIAGNGTSGFSGDGGLATAARIGQALGAHADAMGNIYIDDKDNRRIRKVTPAGIISTIAGGGASTADGIPATSANLSLDAGATMAIDAYGNIYVVDGQRIRKINVATGIITNITGTGTAGFSGDGGPATAAQINFPGGICFDISGNMYIGDGGNNRIRKINTTGIISTYAGTGVLGFGGDGGPATAAQFNSPDGVHMDRWGNLYIADVFNFRIRKIDPSGIIRTYAGSGTSGFGGDGGAATAARFYEPSNVCADSYGNLYIADFHNGRIRKVDPLGTITTFAGGGSSLGSGVPATSASFTDTWGVSIDQNDNVYVCDRNHYMIRRVDGLGAPTVIADSFFVIINNSCGGMNFRITSNNWSSGQHVKTYFGNGMVLDTAVSAYGTKGIADVYKSYITGAYTVKHVLYNGASAIDSIVYARNFSQCQDFSVSFYYDANTNCVKDASDVFISQPISVEVDSAGVAIDTLSCTSGLYYTAYGATGTTYAFRVISIVPGLLPLCPTAGIIYDTISAAGNSRAKKYIGFTCSSMSGHDLQIFTSFRAGFHHFGGTIIANNTYCAPPAATITMQLSPKYTDDLHFVPAPTSISGYTISWNVSSLSSVISAPFLIKADMEKTPGVLLPFGDTAITRYTINPIAGDGNPGDNIVIRNDTVQTGYDPNDIAVSPEGCLTSGINSLTYTIRFENTGNDTAFNIHILDTLSNDLDPGSIQIVAASAVMNTSIVKAGGYAVVKFDFPDIKLLDSSYHGLNMGMVVYSIKLKTGRSYGTVIPNRAGIYFDDNAVVLTNIVNNIIGCPITLNTVSSDIRKLDIYPNPATDQLSIKTDNETYTSLSITNTMGQQIMQQSFSSSQTTVDVKMLPPGLYYITLRGEPGSVVRKFVKM